MDDLDRFLLTDLTAERLRQWHFELVERLVYRSEGTVRRIVVLGITEPPSVSPASSSESASSG